MTEPTTPHRLESLDPIEVVNVPPNHLRAQCITVAAAFIVDVKLVETGVVHPDDTGPWICELANQLYQYISDGIVPEYPDQTDR